MHGCQDSKTSLKSSSPKYMGAREFSHTPLPTLSIHPRDHVSSSSVGGRRRASGARRTRAAAAWIRRKEAAAEQPWVRDLMPAQHLTFGDEWGNGRNWDHWADTEPTGYFHSLKQDVKRDLRNLDFKIESKYKLMCISWHKEWHLWESLSNLHEDIRRLTDDFHRSECQSYCSTFRYFWFHMIYPNEVIAWNWG